MVIVIVRSIISDINEIKQHPKSFLLCFSVMASVPRFIIAAFLYSPSMIAKMRGLLDPTVKFEVDYEKAANDVCNVFMHWQNNSAAGKMAIIPDIDDCDECYAAVKIFHILTMKQNQYRESFLRILDLRASISTTI